MGGGIVESWKGNAVVSKMDSLKNILQYNTMCQLEASTLVTQLSASPYTSSSTIQTISNLHSCDQGL